LCLLGGAMLESQGRSVTPHHSATHEIIDISLKYIVSVIGNAVSFHKAPESPLGPHAQARPHSASGTKPNKISLLERTKGRRNALHKLLQSLSSKPKHFITLDFEGRTADPEQLILAKRCLDNFSRVLRREHPASWFIWKLELSPTRTLHYHMIGDFNEELDDISILKLKKAWQRIAGTSWDGCFDLRACTDAHAGYLTKRAKLEADMGLVALDSKIKSFGILNRRNVRLEKPKRIVLDHAAMLKARAALASCVGDPRFKRHIAGTGAALVLGIPAAIIEEIASLPDLKSANIPKAAPQRPFSRPAHALTWARAEKCSTGHFWATGRATGQHGNGQAWGRAGPLPGAHGRRPRGPTRSPTAGIPGAHEATSLS